MFPRMQGSWEEGSASHSPPALFLLLLVGGVGVGDVFAFFFF